MDSPLRVWPRQFTIYNKIKDLIFRLPMFLPKPVLEDVSWGNDFPDKHFLVIRRGEYGVGLFSLFMTNLAWIRYAHDHGLIPVVDMQTEGNIYQRKAIWRRENSWESFFEQPNGFALKDIRHASNITIARAFRDVGDFLPNQWMDPDEIRNPVISMWRRIVKKYIRIKHGALEKYHNAELEAALVSGQAVLGVLARGTDYTRLKPAGHPIQPDFEQIVSRIEELKRGDVQFEKIYLISEDAEMVKSFKDRYGDDLILAKQSTIKYRGGYLADNRDVKNSVEQGIGYLKAIVDLARCDYLVAGRTSGAIGALLLSTGFKRVSFFDLGAY